VSGEDSFWIIFADYGNNNYNGEHEWFIKDRRRF